MSDIGQSCSPVLIKERLRLSQLDVASNNVTWCRVTMSSDAYICIREKTNSDSSANEQIKVVDIRNQNCSSQTFHFETNSAKISPLDPNGRTLLAVKVHDHFNVMKLENGATLRKLSSTTLEDVEHWTWLDPNTVGLVTDKAVFHWLIEEGEVPQKAFSRHQRLDYSEIISYKTDPSGSWFALTGLFPQADSIDGETQLYSSEKCLSQCIHAHAVLLASYRFSGNTSPSTVLCTANRDSKKSCRSKVHVVELGQTAEGNLAPWSYHDDIEFKEDVDRYDFPVSLQLSSETGLLFVVTKYAQLCLCDVESATCLYVLALCSDIVFTSALNTTTQGLIVINRAGQVLEIDVNLDELIQNSKRHPRKRNAVERLDKLLPLIPHRYLL